MKKKTWLMRGAAVLITAAMAATAVIPQNKIVSAESQVLEEENKTDISETPSELRQLYAQSACMMDGDSGRILFEKNAQEQRPMASTTKILTCIVTLENANLDDVITVSAHAAKQPDVQLNALAGEQFKLKNLLYSLMLESHNDSAVAIAEYIGGSVEGFAAMMNQKAKEIGCTKYHFVTPNGLDSQDSGGQHSISAEDLAKIMRYCIKESPKSKEFLEITRTPSVTFSNESGSRSFSCNNHNAFLHMMSGALTGKTGFTGKAGYCYIGVVKSEERTFIVALLACGWPHNKTYKWSDMRKLVNYGMKYYQFQNILEKDKKLKSVKVEDGIPKSGNRKDTAYTSLKVDYESDNSLNVLLKDGEKVEIVYDIPKKIQAPVCAGDVVGSVSYYLDGEELKKYPIFVEKPVKRINFGWCLRHLFDNFLV